MRFSQNLPVPLLSVEYNIMNDPNPLLLVYNAVD